MVDIKPGSRLKVGSETVTVETVWNQGHHRVFKLTDGRLLNDLHKRSDVEVLRVESNPTGRLEQRPRDFQLKLEDGEEDKMDIHPSQR